ncbi:DHS-like NAD/FAD-binding domain-containing protein [Coprinopsis marcescibilis]|uniref:DHS-like NAD/FAD-binding domain-containing protein n=1 Tax=Coprinopsis marcescibilis TaxID=230819 RepID=A0A5C3LAP8_COPMA|nr:DHS-like NAD/FAD-binding domain-containing protein [Coprinopsis marcescibilis]
MRVSVPHIPQAILDATPTQYPVITAVEAVSKLCDFVRSGSLTVLTGAGVSVDSGIRAYRGPDGRYMNPNYKPIFYHELVEQSDKGRHFRQRYWLRSYLGYPPVRDAQPNTTHFALASLMHTGHISKLITQNVDGLHHKALRQAGGGRWPESQILERILELHGTLHRVHCSKGHSIHRKTFQSMLSSSNPQWREFAEEMERTNTQPRTNPDGDVAIEHLGVSYQDFVIPNCPTCFQEGNHNTVHKPEVVFFGESISKEVKERSFHDVETADKLLLIGTTLATFSAYRLVKRALEMKKPVMLLNVGPTRADSLAGIEKINMSTGTVLTETARALVGSQENEDPVLAKLLTSGIVTKPMGDDSTSPRAVG